jgi:protein-S-isoprenylcysteine O-methyltransferase Ste14
MTLVIDPFARGAPARDEPPPDEAPTVQAARVAARESFPLFVRIAGAMWFGFLALISFRATLGPAAALVSGLGDVSAVAFVVSRFCVALFYAIGCWLLMARPPPMALHDRAAPVFTAFVGTYLVWLIPLIPPAPSWPPLQEVSAVVCVVGEALVVYTICKLGRSFSIAPQARRLVTDGPYRLIRHPLYATEELALIGVLMQHVWWGALAFLAVHLALQIRRMLYEESLLKAVFPDYVAYARRTARLIPGVW